MHKNIKTVAGCFTNVTCNVSATDGREVDLTAYIAIGRERRPVSKRGTNVFAFPAVEYGQHLYEIRADGKPLIFGFLLVRPSAFPVAEGTVDYTLNATLSSIDALHIDIVLTPGPRGYSAYDIAVMEGFEGSEAEWLEHMRQLTATLAVERVTPLMERAETAADKSESAASAAKTERESAAAHAAAAKESELAAAKHKTAAADEVEKAKLERETAATHATAAAQSAQDAMANQQAAEQAAQDAAQAQTGAEQAKTDADAAKLAAQTSEQNAKASADAAAADKAAAEQAKNDALAAQTTAEEQAAIAKLAAEGALAPESIAAQAARPATMVLLKDELLSLLGDASSFDVDTDGQKIVVHTSRLEGDSLEAVEDMLRRFVPGFLEVTRYNHHIEYTYAEYMKYADVETLEEMRTRYPDYMNDVTETGVWAYNLDNMTTVHCHGGGAEVWARLFNRANNIVKLYLSLPKLTYDGTYMVRYCDNLEELEIFYNSIVISVRENPKLRRAKIIAPKAYFIDHLFEGSPLLEEWEVVADWPNVERINNSFRLQKTLTSWNTPLPRCHTMQQGNFSSEFTSWEVDLPALKLADTAFSYCTLDKASVLRICNSIPTWTDGATHKLGMGIHVDLQTDEEVLDAIAAAEGRGWVLAVTWRGTPSVAAAASTFGLRDPLIYAKVGEYEDVDGKLTRVLEWCHYVTNEEGYETFRSLESAYEYFGLPEPEETLTNE